MGCCGRGAAHQARKPSHEELTLLGNDRADADGLGVDDEGDDDRL